MRPFSFASRRAIGVAATVPHGAEGNANYTAGAAAGQARRHWEVRLARGGNRRLPFPSDARAWPLALTDHHRCALLLSV